MADPAHVWTDEKLKKMEAQIAKEYKKAHKEISEKLDDYWKRYALKDKKWQEWVATGKKTPEAYQNWVTGQVMTGARWAEMKESLAQDYLNAKKIAESIVDKNMPSVYAINHNYGTFEIEKGSALDTSYTLYSRETVERMWRDNPRLYHKPGEKISQAIKDGTQKAWDKRRIQSVLTQGVLQGESITNLTKRLEKVTAGDHKAAIRNARTMVTGIQNAGRIDAYKRANDLGIPTKKQWLATLDSRTRHWHRDLDGQTAETDEPFEHSIPKLGKVSIMYPGDPDAEPADIYNCRCTLLAAIQGHEIDVTNTSLRHDKNLEHKTYEEWEADHNSISHPITKQEDIGQAMKASYIKEYKGHAGNMTGVITDVKASEGQAMAVNYFQDQMDSINQAEYANIWKDPVHPSDYATKKDAIPAKRQYFEDQLALANKNGWAVKEQKFTDLLKNLDEFEDRGIAYEKAKDMKESLGSVSTKELQKAAKQAQTTKAAKKTTPFTKEAYTADRKSKAKKFTDKNAADKYHRPKLDDQWNNLTEYQQYSVWKYTENSNPMNKPLSGYESNWSRGSFKGIGKANWGVEDNWRTLQTQNFRKKFTKDGIHVDHAKTISELTQAIDKCTLADDVWLVRGSSYEGLAGLIEGGGVMSYDDALHLLKNGTTEELRAAFQGATFKNHAFTSTGIASGTGFSGDALYEVYAPAGTKAIYAEPASYFGDTISGEKLYKKGAKYNSVGHEAEVITQRGTEYLCDDITREWDGHLNIQMSVCNQPDYFKTGYEQTVDNGKTSFRR